MIKKWLLVIGCPLGIFIIQACSENPVSPELQSGARTMSDEVNANAPADAHLRGTAMYRERMSLPTDAIFEATLEDISRADAPATVLGRARIEPAGHPPFRFTINYDPARLERGHTYSIRARVMAAGQLLFTTDRHYALPSPSEELSILLVKAQSAPTAAAMAALEDTYWKLVRLGNAFVNVGAEQREPHLVLHSQDRRVAGFGGCNRIIGAYAVSGEELTFSQMGGTMMACPDGMQYERAFHDALLNVSRWRIDGGTLELFDAAGTSLALFEAKPPRSAADSRSLAGSSWRLVQFMGGDDRKVSPDDKSKYTLSFVSENEVAVRFDCNRGRATWKSAEPSLIEFGPLALTRAMCANPSLHDRLVKQWPYIRSYVMQDDHLFLSLMADGGVYEFEPSPAAP